MRPATFNATPSASAALVADTLPVLSDSGTPPSYFNMLKKRWRLIAVVAAVIFAACFATILSLPVLYQADVLVILQSGRLISPSNNAQMAQPDFRQKLDALREQVESRHTLNEVLQQRNLFPPGVTDATRQQIINTVRKAITLRIDSSSFRLLFDHSDPQTAADVANDLARKFIDENARLRSESLQKTAALITSQTVHLENQVKEVAQVLQRFRHDNMGSMPEDVPANQALLMALTNQVLQAESNLRAENLRKRQVEELVAEAIAREIEQRNAAIIKIGQSIRQFQAFTEELDRPSAVIEQTPEKAPSPETAGPSREAQKNAPALSEQSHHGIEIDPEIQVLKEQLSMKALSVRTEQQNLTAVTDLHRRGMISQSVLTKAQNDVERSKSDLRVQRAQAGMLRSSLVDKQKKAESDILALNQLQHLWNQTLSKLQEFNSLRTVVNKEPIEMQPADEIQQQAVSYGLTTMRRVQMSLSSFDIRGELTRHTQEYENILLSVSRQRNSTALMKDRMNELDRRLNNSAKVQVELPELTRRYSTLTDQYESMLKYKVQTEMAMSVEDQQEGERMQIWDSAVVPSSPFQPNYRFLIVAALIGSIGSAVSLALLFGSYESIVMMSKYLNVDDLHMHTGLEILSSIKQINSKIQVPPTFPLSCAKIATLHSPQHPVSRQFLDCCCVISRSGVRMPRVIAVCSPIPGDGKSFVAANFAAALALTTKLPTLLVDGNLRSPHLHDLFSCENESGLADAVEGRGIHVHRLPLIPPADLSLLTAGSSKGHSSVVLSSAKVHELLRHYRCADTRPMIVLDTPALSCGPDADLLLDGVDAVLLVIRRNYTPLADVTRIMRRIPRQKLLGVIFNGDLPD